MSKAATFTFSVVSLLFVVLVAALLQPDWAADLGLQGCTHCARAWFCQDNDILPEIPALDRRHEKKWRVVTELLDGRLTLFEAAALFQRLNAEYPGPQPDPLARGDTDEERACWQVIHMIPTVWASRSADSADQVVAHFVDELQRHKQQYGKVVLPIE